MQVPNLLLHIETTGCEVDAEGHLNALLTGRVSMISSFRYPELSQYI
jgi:hypothetical protein